MPPGKQVMGSFEDWVRVMGGILDVAGIPGFLSNRQRMYIQINRESAEWLSFCNVWWAEHGTNSVGIAVLVAMAEEHDLLMDIRAGVEERNFRVSLGRKLSKMRDRRINRYAIRVSRDGHTGANMYRLELQESLSAEDAEDAEGCSNLKKIMRQKNEMAEITPATLRTTSSNEWEQEF